MTEAVDKREVRVAAVMTAPRHEITWARTHIQKALSVHNIPLTVSGGVYYGQCMQSMLSGLVKTDCDYVLTIDYDSVFTHDDVRRLLTTIIQADHIDAICGMQPRRGKGVLLGGLYRREKTLEWNGQPLQLDSAHFGLTLIDLKKLATVPKPWFLCVPDENGEFGENRIDDDVYFWKQWHEAGYSVYCDPSVRVGHLEEMVAMFDEQLQVQHVYPNNWEIENDRVAQALERLQAGEPIPADAAECCESPAEAWASS